MPKNILIIEDDRDTNNRMAEVLSDAGYACDQAFSGTDGLVRVRESSYALIILDLTLSGISGESLLSLIREEYAMPVIVVSDKGSLNDRIRILNAGADDYLIKPFEMQELVMRVSVWLRRFAEEEHGKNSLKYKDLVMDTDHYTVTARGKDVSLTRQEFKILELMLKYSPGRVFSKKNFYEQAWETAYMGEDKTINVHISNIRKKLKRATGSDYIETVWGVGFRLMK